ncbi:MAG: VOC family protein [Acidimicrobiales bacterium]
MRPRIHVVTLAVEDIERALDFYRRLGFEGPGIVGTEWLGDDEAPAGAVGILILEDGFFLCLYPRPELAKDARIPLTSGAPGEFSLGHAVASREEVDRTIAAAVAAGGRLTDPPHDRAWGIYSGYFQDLDGHLWEVIWNPALENI